MFRFEYFGLENFKITNLFSETLIIRLQLSIIQKSTKKEEGRRQTIQEQTEYVKAGSEL